jgi:hypothetical protein
VRSIDVSSFVGRGQALVESESAWADGGLALVLAIGGAPRAVSASSAGGGAPNLSRTGGTLRLIVVQVGPDDAPLNARAVLVRGLPPGSFLWLASDGETPDSVIVEQLVPDGSDVFEAPLSRTVTGAHLLAHIRSALTLVFDPSGTRLLYLLGHSPPALWSAAVIDGQLRDRRPLLRNSEIDAVAW